MPKELSNNIESLETNISTIFEEILPIKDIRANDNFFDIGVNSLHIMAIQIRIMDRYDVEVSTMDFYNMPTLREISLHIAKQLNT
jgi:acyl carrier protein